MISTPTNLREHLAKRPSPGQCYNALEKLLLRKLCELEALRLEELWSSNPWHKNRAAMEDGNEYWRGLTASYLTGVARVELRRCSARKGLIPSELLMEGLTPEEQVADKLKMRPMGYSPTQKSVR